MIARSYIKLFFDWPEMVSMLPEDAQGRLIAALARYARGDEDYAAGMCGPEAILFPALKGQIDRDNKAYAHACEVNRENGRRSGRPRKDKNPVGFF